ncbi:MAG: hypothetical protein MUE73_06800 [Planctomycetes bacterium]|jgi:tetratricopeptide (TPR) repeat protein|nr:hypothetical protein [Planctomycetota bacterium]
MDGERPGGRGAHGRLTAVLCIAAAVFVVFGGTLRHEFVEWDDDLYTEKLPHLQSLGAEDLAWMLTDTSHFYWHPLSYLLMAAENVLFGDQPSYFHLVSLLLHLVNSLLVFRLGLRLLDRGFPGRSPGAASLAALFAALFFAVHPLRMEPVAWVSAQKGLLCTLFCLLTVLAWLRWGEGEGERRLRFYAAAFACFALALASQPLAATLPLALLVLDFWPLRRRGVGRLLLEKLPFLAGAVAAASLSVADPRQADLMPSAAISELGPRLVASTWGLVFPAAKTAWPLGLSPFYPLAYTADLTLLHPLYGLSTLALLALLAAAILLLRRGLRWPLAALLLYLLAVGPVSGLRQAGSIATADRFAYLPSIVPAILLGAVALRLARFRAVIPVAAVVLAALAALSLRGQSVFRDSESLWTRVVRLYPGRCATAHNNLGAAFHRRAILEDDASLLTRATAHYRAAVAARPDHANGWNNLGLVCSQQGAALEAEQCYRKAVALRPKFSLAHANLAVLLVRLGRRQEAREHWAIARAGGGWVDAPIREFLDRSLK